jgi:hypothetical protein
MLTADVEEGPKGFERGTFSCSRCGHSEQMEIASDPLMTRAVGWLRGDLRAPK